MNSVGYHLEFIVSKLQKSKKLLNLTINLTNNYCGTKHIGTYQTNTANPSNSFLP